MDKRIAYFILLISTLLFYQAMSNTKPRGMIFVPSGNLEGDSVTAFYMDKSPVTVKDFRVFVEASTYQTDAERLGNATIYDFQKKEWQLKKGATWAFPLGKDGAAALDNHPVTQVSWSDAQAYCKWAQKRLPTKVEWEYAARNASNNKQLYPWGNELIVKKRYKANCWQGTFPQTNLMKDGFRFTSPVGHYGKSPLGLVDLAGNVWEWTVSELQLEGQVEKIQKGGSFMCEQSVCHGYQIKGESSASIESSLFHVGFRCVQDVRN